MRRISSIGIAVGVTALLGGTALAQSDDIDEVEVEVEDDGDIDVEADVEPSPYGTTQPVQPTPTRQPPPVVERETTTVVVEPRPQPQPQAAPQEYELRSQIGIQVSVGGGVTGFIDDETRDFTSLGGAWEARVAVGTRYPVSVEAAYIGGAQDMDALGLDDDAILLANGAELGARANILSGMTPVQPYIMAAAAWKRYDITNSQFNTSNLNDEENVLEIPVGAGIGFKLGPLLMDLRGTYRPAFFDDLTRVSEDEFDTDPAAELDSWRASLNGGFNF